MAVLPFDSMLNSTCGNRICSTAKILPRQLNHNQYLERANAFATAESRQVDVAALALSSQLDTLVLFVVKLQQRTKNQPTRLEFATLAHDPKHAGSRFAPGFS